MKCPKCTETQSIKVRKDPGKSNVYGYPEDELPKVKVTYEYVD